MRWLGREYQRVLHVRGVYDGKGDLTGWKRDLKCGHSTVQKTNLEAPRLAWYARCERCDRLPKWRLV